MKDITPSPRKVHPVTQAREEMGLPKEGLAFKAGVTLKTIERIERGGPGTPHRLNRRAIAEVLGRDPADLWPEKRAA